MAATATAPRLQALYREEIRDQLKERLELDNIMEVPRFVKIVVNMGVGEAVAQATSRSHLAHPFRHAAPTATGLARTSTG